MSDEVLPKAWPVIVRCMYISLTFATTSFMLRDGAAALPLFILGWAMVVVLDILTARARP